jgi:hypothetical protein
MVLSQNVRMCARNLEVCAESKQQVAKELLPASLAEFPLPAQRPVFLT